jgi:hypothetical protein
MTANRTLDVSARPVTGRARRKARPAPARSSRQRDRYTDITSMPLKTNSLTILLVVIALSRAVAQDSSEPKPIEEQEIITQGTTVQFGRTACGTVCPERITLRKAARTADVIFVGTVVGMRSEIVSSAVDDPERRAGSEVVVVEYSVDELIKGDAPTRAGVVSYSTGTCGYEPAMGTRFLVVSNLSEGRLWTAPMLGTQLAQEASADIVQLRKRFARVAR